MSSREWSRYMHDVIGLADPPEEINAEVVRRMRSRYASEVPIIDGAVEAVKRLSSAFRRAGVVLEPADHRCSSRSNGTHDALRGDGVV